MQYILENIKSTPLPTNQYINEVVSKDQIFIHHTASSASPVGVLDWWATTPDRVGTAFIIAGAGRVTSGWKDGDIHQCFHSSKWGWHLGLKGSHLVRGGRSSRDLNAKSIGIEICNWGWLTLKNDKFYSYVDSVVPESRVVEYDSLYKGKRYYEKYTDAQLENTRKLLIYLSSKYEIDPKFKGPEIFDIDRRCLMGESGIWTHTSVRPDKFDCHPQPELIQMLESL
ncbi:MAG: N-acetylmuramoyl-L-alanine amidase [Bacteroidetes bacterium]|nr:N-acetylmuramoyl-L-alanine amidase [Bacteroidota bacterium]